MVIRDHPATPAPLAILTPHLQDTLAPRLQDILIPHAMRDRHPAALVIHLLHSADGTPGRCHHGIGGTTEEGLPRALLPTAGRGAGAPLKATRGGDLTEKGLYLLASEQPLDYGEHSSVASSASQICSVDCTFRSLSTMGAVPTVIASPASA